MMLIAAMIAGATVPAPTLWQNTQVGMTYAEVKRAQPEAVEPAKPSTLNDGASCQLSLPKFEVNNDPYTVCFFFKNGALSQVMLTANGDPYESQFRGIVTALRVKYGPEVDLHQSSLGYEADWMTKQGVNVSVTYFNKLGNLLNINYQIRLAKEADRL
ncbi:hypothetical protein C8J25_103359 [Sphingomonas faeni]|uniref:Uncharacterized protein n=1 Tax=Sphingomonas faeni TaxID=185950 RepID=A0A2T5U847_9SPHN|nr:hypothetical protein [Sphingomonas faeni]PTW47638.1 hypothetical protein C8J25_103359 [Sphingomonas faeni]